MEYRGEIVRRAIADRREVTNLSLQSTACLLALTCCGSFTSFVYPYIAPMWLFCPRLDLFQCVSASGGVPRRGQGLLPVCAER